MSVFEAAKNGGGAMPTISINITGMSTPKVETLEDITDIG
jgi:hypothetical protein